MKSIGQISKELGVPVHRLNYVIRSRGIKEVTRAGGTVRLFDDAAIGQIKFALNAMEISKKGVQT
jgi:hypothetical protein